jgi:hypothetical protein
MEGFTACPVGTEFPPEVSGYKESMSPFSAGSKKEVSVTYAAFEILEQRK